MSRRRTANRRPTRLRPSASAALPAPTVVSVTGLSSPLYQWSMAPSSDLDGVVNGSDFSGVTSVTVDGVACTITAQTATTIDITIPGADVPSSPLLTAGAKDVIVTQPSGSATLVGGVTVTAWTPATPAGLTGWWAADDVVTGGGTVSQMNDKSGNGRHLKQGTGANQPAYSASDSDFNSLPSVSFDGTNDFLDCDNGAAVTIGTLFSATAKTSYAFIRTSSPVSGTNSTAAGAYNNDAVWEDTGGYAGMTMTSGLPGIWAYNYDTTPVNGIGVSVTVAANTRYACIMTHNSPDLYMRTNNNPESSSLGDATATAVTTGQYRVGRYAGNYAQFKMTEMATYNVALSTADKDRLANRAAATWGI